VNVLLTAAGRRSYLVRYFQQALRGAGRVLAANSHHEAPAMTAADVPLLVPPSHSDEYPETIAELCQRHEVALLCSCHDLDVLALAPMRERLRQHGTTAMLPDVEWARICLDKFACGERLRASGILTPWASVSLERTLRALAAAEVRFPIVVKARLGFGSLGLYVCHDEVTLRNAYRRAFDELRTGLADEFLPLPPEERVLMQAALDGPERCVDLVHDLNGDYAAHFVCEVHAMRAGESDSATTLPHDVLGDLPHRLAALTRHPGIWGVDVMMDGTAPKVIDVNPRFTGDYPFHHLAGADVPAALLAWVAGEEPKDEWLRPATGVRGFKDLVPTRAHTPDIEG
jgi:carbamoyl-phosphate synthase large subunit